MKFETTLDRIHARTVENRLLQLFTSCLRVLLALAFIPPSIPKITHQPFTLIPPTDPVGAYFAALYNTGYYYDFLGWSQLAAALLLLIPRTSHIGALIFLPIIVNITVLTNSVGFTGTWLVTILMTIACTYLVCWDYPRWKSVLFSEAPESSKFSNLEFIIIPLALGSLSAMAGGFLFLKGAPIRVSFVAFWFCFGFVFGMIATVHHRFMKNETAGANETV